MLSLPFFAKMLPQDIHRAFAAQMDGRRLIRGLDLLQAWLQCNPADFVNLRCVFLGVQSVALHLVRNGQTWDVAPTTVLFVAAFMHMCTRFRLDHLGIHYVMAQFAKVFFGCLLVLVLTLCQVPLPEPQLLEWESKFYWKVVCLVKHPFETTEAVHGNTMSLEATVPANCAPEIIHRLQVLSAHDSKPAHACFKS